jgi:hypothetical protein
MLDIITQTQLFIDRLIEIKEQPFVKFRVSDAKLKLSILKKRELTAEQKKYVNNYNY